MDITGPQLEAQYERAIAAWPWMHDVERDHDLPPFLLAATGSKETNLANIKGDYTQRSGEASARYHGFGVWQRDIDAWGIPAGWLDDVRAQAEWSADLLRSNIERTGSLSAGVTAYNGSGPAARAYAVDVLDRLAYLTANYPAPAPPTRQPEEITVLYDCATPDPAVSDTATSGKTFLLRGAGPPDWIRDPADVDKIRTVVTHVGTLTLATHRSFGGQ